MKLSIDKVGALSSVYSRDELKNIETDKYDIYIEEKGEIFCIFSSQK